LVSIGFACAIVIGMTLGLIGGGGSILTVPVLVYFLGIPPVLATAYSLFIIGIASLIGAVQYMRRGMVSYKTAAFFATPAFTAVFLSRKYVVPAIPERILAWGTFTLTKDIAIMLLFAVLMVLASISMIKKSGLDNGDPSKQEFKAAVLGIEGFIVGSLTGMVGAGGGFLIIPSLVVLAKLPMHVAVGTSLLIIAINSLIGFTGDLNGQHAIDWIFLLSFSAFAIAGIVWGSYLARKIPGSTLKPAFGWFVLITGIFIVLREMMKGYSSF